jgi:chromosome segregation ATPase
MFFDAPETLMYVTGGAFLLGWLVGKIGSHLGSGVKTRKRDPRDDRIRNLLAELRIGQTNLTEAQEKLTVLQTELVGAKELTERHDEVVSEQQQVITQLQSDLKDSILKTRELREELSNRATESVKSEVKLREVETELSIAHASTDMIATGVLDYSLAPDSAVEIELDEEPEEPEVVLVT